MSFSHIISKCYRELYLLLRPSLWGERLHINGIPVIGNRSRLILGYDVSLNSNCYIHCVGGVKIGDCVTISYGCMILSSGLDTNNYPNICLVKDRKHVLQSVEIGDGVWLCAGCKVMPGVRIANKVIVGAGSVVTKDCDKEGWLYGGVPARPIKSLYKDNQK